MKDLKLILLIFFLGFFFTDTYSQEIWQVDSRIESMSVKDKGNSKIINIQVKADNDDTERSPTLIVSLPRNSKVTSVNMNDNFKNTPYQVMGHGNLALSHVKENIDSYVQFDLRNLNKETFDVSISISPTSGGFQKDASVSAFIFGITPELNKENNFKNIPLPQNSLIEDCLSFNRNNLKVESTGTKFLVTDGISRMMVFKTRVAAEKAIKAIKNYNLDSQCFCDRPQPGLRYFLTNGEIPSGSMAGEDCNKISSPNNLSIRRNSATSYSIIDTALNSIPFSAKSEKEAQNIIDIIKKHKAKYTCYISRPNAGMVYLRK